MILLVCRKFRAVVVTSLLVAGLGLMLPLPAAAGQADRGRFPDQGLVTSAPFTPAKVLSWLTGLWQDLSGLWAGGAVEKASGGDGLVLSPADGSSSTNGGCGSDEGPGIDPNGG